MTGWSLRSIAPHDFARLVDEVFGGMGMQPPISIGMNWACSREVGEARVLIACQIVQYGGRFV